MRFGRSRGNDKAASIDYSKTAVAFHYYAPTTPGFVAALQKSYPVWMTESSDEAPGSKPDCDLPWYLDCEMKGISWNSMDFKNTLQKCREIKEFLIAKGHGWKNDEDSNTESKGK